MKKKIRKIPKFNNGTTQVGSITVPYAPTLGVQFTSPLANSTQSASTATNNAAANGTTWGDMNSTQKAMGVVGAAGTAFNIAANSIGKPVTAQGVVSGIGQGASAGAAIGGPWGAVIGGAAGGLLASIGTGGSVDETTGELTKPSGIAGLFGHSMGYLRAKQSRVKTSINDRRLTEDLNERWASDPNNSLNTNIYATAAEGAVIRKPVDALVSKGELIYDPETKELTKVPGSKGKPNTDDDQFVKLKPGSIVLPNSNNSKRLTTNDKTLAYNLEPMVDKPNIKMSKGTIEARDRIIKKAARINEMTKNEPQEYAMFHDGGWAGEIKTWDDYLKYSYNLSTDNKLGKLEDFWGYDAKDKKYKTRWKEIIDYVGSNEKLREKAIKDLGGLSYVGTGENAWDNIVKAAYDKKVADVHRYFKDIGNFLQTPKEPMFKSPIIGVNRIINVPKEVRQKAVRTTLGGLDHITDYVPEADYVKLKNLTPEQIASEQARVAALLKEPKKPTGANKFDWGKIGEMIADYAPLAAALFGDYDYHKEEPMISPSKYIPTGVSIEPIRRAANESYAQARYNQANINPNTGAGMAYGLQAASNRTKSLADAHQWQQEQQNKLIAQNVGIYNDWTRRFDAARYQAIADTRGNEGAAQQMRDSAIRDALEFTQGRRNDRMRLAAMEPLAKYAFDDETYKQIYKRGIV